MKKLLLIILIFCSIGAIAQVPISDIITARKVVKTPEINSPGGTLVIRGVTIFQGGGAGSSTTSETTITYQTNPTTGERALCVLVTAGELIAKGEVLTYLIGGTPGKVTKCPTTGASHSMPVGVAFSSAALNGTLWMAVEGLVQVLPEAGITAAFGNVLATSSSVAGRAMQSSTVPVSTHWDEVGHWANTGTGNGVLTLAIIHFN